MDYPFIEKQDKEVAAAIHGEEKREEEGLELIPSENYVSRAVREALGSVMTNKYSEGYPGARYYGGQMYTDVVENIARDRAKQLFNCKFANVQPLSGAPANVAMYFALLQPGDTVLGMDLSHGGHLTHGHPVTYLTKIFNFVRYKMKDTTTGEIDYDEMREVAKREKPKIVLAGYSAYSRELDYDAMVSIAREVGAVSVMDIAHIAGLIAGKAVEESVRRRLRHHDDDDAQDHAWPARRHDTHARERGHREEDRQIYFPRIPGRAAHAPDRGQGSVLWRGVVSEVP